MRQILVKSIKEQTGSAALEFALIIPVFFILIFGVLDVIKLLLVEEQLDKLARDLAFHYKHGVSSDYKASLKQTDVLAKAKDFASSRSLYLTSHSTLTASSEIYADLSAYASGLPETSVSAAGSSGQIVAYRLEFFLPLTSPVLMLVFDGRTAQVTAFSISKNGR
ncbi:MAG: pilus assembly protein [Proteobacteria bacterium]|nr:pilus assembly protein [Pseudomonadota bacterium]